LPANCAEPSLNAMKYFVKPSLDAYSSVEGANYFGHYKTYSEYNYLRPGVSSIIKARHFEIALRLTRNQFHKCNVLDFGCGDGIFLPSLARHFKTVMAIDNNRESIKICEGLLSTLKLTNVELMCNDNLMVDDLRLRLLGRSYGILYLLETLEHVGDKDSPYESRIAFLKKMATLIPEDGIMVISVPKMVGISFLIQRMGLAALGLHRDAISLKNLLKAAFLNDTKELEKTWVHHTHLGFNHKKLEPHLNRAFHVLLKKDLLFQVLYVIGKRKTLAHSRHDLV
jgi:2-polyprenyl-3-methyl-5-hydroxy-6-metoxy-1,4-benzoquinol methylase